MVDQPHYGMAGGGSEKGPFSVILVVALKCVVLALLWNSNATAFFNQSRR